jgi:hypothetical protein
MVMMSLFRQKCFDARELVCVCERVRVFVLRFVRAYVFSGGCARLIRRACLVVANIVCGVLTLCGPDVFCLPDML